MTFRAVAGNNKYMAVEADRPLPIQVGQEDVHDGSEVTFTDSGVVELFDGDSGAWVDIGKINTVSVHGATIRISHHTGKITSIETGAAFARAPGSTRLLLESLELGSITEFAVIAFGTSVANAQSNLVKSGITPNIISEAGAIIRSGDSTLGVLPSCKILDWPVNATHAALGNGTAGNDQVIMVSQGVA